MLLAKAANANVEDPLAAEYRILLARVVARREQADRLRSLAERIEEETAREEHLLRELESVLDLAPQLRIEHLDSRLRGEQLRDVAVQVLARKVGEGRAIHYREWFDLLLHEGYKVGGRDPLATFLAQVNRADAVERVGRRSGRYRLRVVV